MNRKFTLNVEILKNYENNLFYLKILTKFGYLIYYFNGDSIEF